MQHETGARHSLRSNSTASHKYSIASAFLLILMLVSIAPAQTFRGTILGTVTDPNGAVVPGAKVTVKNILSKLGANDRTHAAMIGLKRGIIEL